jgi:hypothetical protein
MTSPDSPASLGIRRALPASLAPTWESQHESDALNLGTLHAMDDSPLSPEEIRAAAEVHHELGPEYSDAVVASFLGRVDREITARIEARLAAIVPSAAVRLPEASARDGRRAFLKGLAVGLSAAPVPLLWFWDLGSRSPDQNLGQGLVVLAFVVTTVICTVGAFRARSTRCERSGARR